MQRNVPQFIEIEEKIFGPFTLKQFAYLSGGVGLSIIAWRTLPSGFSLLVIAPIMGFAIALAFAQFNSKPFIEIVRAAISHSLSNKKHFWENPSTELSQERKKNFIQEAERVARESSNIPTQKSFSREDISDLAKRLNNK